MFFLKSCSLISCLVVSYFMHAQQQPPGAHVELVQENESTVRITLHIALLEGHVLYRDSLDISVDHSQVSLSAWKANQPSIIIFDKRFKKDKQVFSGNLILTLYAYFKKKPCVNAHMHIAYLTSVVYQIHHQIVPLQFSSSSSTKSDRYQTHNESQSLAIPLAGKGIVCLGDAKEQATPIENIATSLCPEKLPMLLLLLLGIFLFFEGLLFLHKARNSVSALDIYSGMLLIVISILVWTYCYSLLYTLS